MSSQSVVSASGVTAALTEEGLVSNEGAEVVPFHLRTSSRPRVQFADDVVDNEHLGKKSSKSTRICFLY
jgi:hypothetical protein